MTGYRCSYSMKMLLCYNVPEYAFPQLRIKVRLFSQFRPYRRNILLYFNANVGGIDIRILISKVGNKSLNEIGNDNALQ